METNFSVRRYIPLHHNDSEYRKDEHKISWILLSTNKICDANNRLGTQVFECMAMFQHQIVQQLDYLQSLSLWTDLQVLKMLEHSACMSVDSNVLKEARY